MMDDSCILVQPIASVCVYILMDRHGKGGGIVWIRHCIHTVKRGWVCRSSCWVWISVHPNVWPLRRDRSVWTRHLCLPRWCRPRSTSRTVTPAKTATAGSGRNLSVIMFVLDLVCCLKNKKLLPSITWTGQSATGGTKHLIRICTRTNK